MTRGFAFVVAALMVLGGVGQAQAQEMDFRNLFTGGPNLGGRGGSSAG